MKKHLQTKFLEFLIEDEKQNRKEDEEIIDEVLLDEDENNEDETQNDFDSDKVIERLVQKLKKTSKEYDDIIYGRK